MGLLSLAIWTPIAFGAVLLALGRDDQARVVRWFQTGYIYHYAFAMIVGVFLLMTWFVWRDHFMLLIK